MQENPLGLHREPGQPKFDEPDKRVVLALATHLADGARRALLLGKASGSDEPDSPGLVILNDRWEWIR